MTGAQFGAVILGLIAVADRRGGRRVADELAVPALLQGARVRAHRAGRPEGGHERRRVRAAHRPRGRARQHEHPAARGVARPGQGAHHQGPHAGGRGLRVLRARPGEGGRHRRRRPDAGPAHAGAGDAEGAGGGQVRRRPPHRRRGDDHGGDAREARRVRQAREGGGGGRPPAERARAGGGVAHPVRPDGHGVLQSRRTPSTPRASRGSPSRSSAARRSATTSSRTP